MNTGGTGGPFPRSRGVIALVEERCTSCMLCVRECPDRCIEIESHKRTVEVDGARPRQENALDYFSIDFGLCMYCGICVDVCPFDALFWAPAYDYPATDTSGLVEGRERLGQWMQAVPAPVALDPGAASGPSGRQRRRGAHPAPGRRF